MREYTRMLLGAAVLTAALSGFCDTLTRWATVRDAEPTAVFAVPNGYTLAGATSAAGAVTIGDATAMAGVSLVPITASTDTVITVTFESGAAIYTGIPSKVIRARIRKMVANPEDVSLTKYVAPTTGTVRKPMMALPTEEEINYVVIAPPAYTNLWQGYVDARQLAHPEVKMALVSTFDIYAEYPVGSEGVRNYAESIHKYLRTDLRDRGLSYVVLGGIWMNVQQLDDAGVWTNESGAVVHLLGADQLAGEAVSITNAVPGVWIHPRYNAEMASDMFYACLDLPGASDGNPYPWTIASNTTYFADSAYGRASVYDAGVDVIVSRISLKPMLVGDKVWSVEELMTAYTNKLARGESPDFPGTGRVGASFSQFGRTYTRDGRFPTERQFYDDMINIFSPERADNYYVDTEWGTRTVFMKYVTPYRPVRAMDVMNDHVWTTGQPSNAAAVTAYYASDRDFGTVNAHGWQEASAWFSLNDFKTSTGLTLFNDVSQPCDTGRMQYQATDINNSVYTKPSLGEGAVAAPTGGALASVNNTYEGLSNQITEEAYSDYLASQMAKGFLGENLNAGETWLESHLAYLEHFSNGSWNRGSDTSCNLNHWHYWVLTEHTLFGDPLVRARAAETNTVATDVFPSFAGSIELAAEVTATGTNAVMTASTAGDLTLTNPDTAKPTRVKIVSELTVGGTAVTIGEGIEGGVGGRGIVFTDEAGTVTLNTNQRFYLAGVSNATDVVVKGSGVILDADGCDTNMLKAITFDVAAGCTNWIRSVQEGVLAHTVLNVTGGGVVVFDSHDLLGDTTVNLADGSGVMVGTDTQKGSLLSSSEPMNGTFEGTGKIICHKGTTWLLAASKGSGITNEEYGEYEMAFNYTGTVGSSPTGWFTAWKDDFSTAKGVLGPFGFAPVIDSATAQCPWYPFPAHEKVTYVLYADLTNTDPNTDNQVMLCLGNHSAGYQNYQTLLCADRKSGKITLKTVYPSSDGKSYVTATQDTFDYPGDGYHVYTVQLWKYTVGKTGNYGVSHALTVDRETRVFTNPWPAVPTDGLQLGSMYGGCVAGFTPADGMVVGCLRGYDLYMDEADIHALCDELPPTTNGVISVLQDVDADLKACSNSVLTADCDAAFPTNTYLGGSWGTINIASNVTVSVPALKFNNQNDTASDVTLNIYGTLRMSVTNDTDDALNIYQRFNHEDVSGALMGHWQGSSTLNVLKGGFFDGGASYFDIDYSAKGTELVRVDGGTFRTKGLGNASYCVDGTWVYYGNYGRLVVCDGGIYETASWPVGAYNGTLPIDFTNSTLRAWSTGWSCPRTISFYGTENRIDKNGLAVSFANRFGGEGAVTIVDSAEGGSFTYNLGIGQTSKMPVRLAFEGDNNYFTWGMSVGGGVFSSGDTVDHPALWVKENAALDFTMRDIAGWSGSFLSDAIIRVDSGATLNLKSSGTSTMYDRVALYLEPGSTTTLDAQSGGLMVYGGTASEAMAQLTVPSGSGTATMKKAAGASADSYISFDTGTGGGTAGAGISVGAGATLDIQLDVKGARNVVKYGAGTLKFSGDVASWTGKLTMKAGTLDLSSGATNLYLTADSTGTVILPTRTVATSELEVYNGQLLFDETPGTTTSVSITHEGARWGNIGSASEGGIATAGDYLKVDNLSSSLDFSDTKGMFNAEIKSNGKVRIHTILVGGRPDNANPPTSLTLIQGATTNKSTSVSNSKGDIPVYNASKGVATTLSTNLFTFDADVEFDTSKPITFEFNSGTVGLGVIKPINSLYAYNSTWSITYEVTGDYTYEVMGKMDEDGVVKEVTVTDVGTADVVVPAEVETVKGVAAEQIKVVTTNGYDITGAFTKSGSATTGVTLALNKDGVVTIGTEDIAVTPELGTITDDEHVKEAPFAVDDEVAVGVKAIPGLKYGLVRGGALGDCALPDKVTVVQEETAKSTRVKLVDEEPPAGAAFYRIRVTR